MVAFLLAAQVLVGAAQPGITWSGPKLTPAESARILAASPGLSNQTYMSPLAPGPVVIIAPSDATVGPYGPFAPFPPARRLDGTLVDSPVQVYGAPLLWPYDGIVGGSVPQSNSRYPPRERRQRR